MKTFDAHSLKAPTRPATETDIEKIGDEDIRDCFDVGDTVVVVGDVEIEGHFDYSDGALIINGNLTVAGNLSGDETGLLCVHGDLETKNLYMEGSLDVVGKANIKEVAFGFYEAGITNLPNLTGKVLICGNHALEAEYDGFEHVFEFDNFSGLSTGNAEDLKKLLNDKTYETLVGIIGIGESDNDDYWGGGFLDESVLR